MLSNARHLLRAGLLVVCVATAAQVVTSGLANAMASRAPERALAYSPNHAKALVAAAELEFGNAANKIDLAVAERRARAALARSPLSPGAFAVLGLVADTRRNTPLAAQLMHVSDELSRRHLLTRIWLIESHVQKDDVAGALGDYDIALRTSAKADELLYPLLENAMSDEALVAPISQLLQKNPPWRDSFIYHAAISGIATRNLARIVSDLDVGVYGEVDLKKLIVDRLIAAKDFAAARTLALPSLPPAARGALLVDGDFADARGYAPVNWQLENTPEIRAERGSDSGTPGLRVSTAMGSGGSPAAQLLALKPGRYRFSSTAGSPPLSGSRRASWTVSCAQSRTTLGSATVTKDPVATMEFTVPAKCDVQWLVLSFPPSAEAQDETFTIAKVALEAVTAQARPH